MAEGFLDSLSDAVDSVENSVSNAVSDAEGAVSDAYNTVADAASSAYDAASSAASDAYDAVSNFAQDTADHGWAQAVSDVTGISAGTIDAADSLAWDVAGVIPGISTAATAASTAIDAGAAIYDYATGDSDHALTRLHEAAYDATGFLPDGVGTGIGIANAALDSAALSDRLAGDDTIPTSGTAIDTVLRTSEEGYRELYDDLTQ